MIVKAVGAGVALGFLDFVWIKFVPFPFGGLGNSIAVWAVAAFLLTYYARWSMLRGATAAVIMQVVAVPSYYVAASLIQRDDWANLWAASSLIWMGLAVVAGVVFGIGGVLARTPGRLRIPALALPGAVLLAELIIELTRLGNPDYPTASIVEYSVLLAALALLVTAVTGRTWRDRALALAGAIPLAGAGYRLMIATAFGG
ncbi:DUF6518 family protein [Actinoplanes derwentensis]|uniref:Uncharacterized protein n=1 Tax=Actinoplanes derwentensis TaxID=113562 RepID=A0A1H1WUI3_9ACTN|nr:DUF6518 family protein [Actinoplanes derwentensis]GID86981.1 hypothetical protein Ade03nite_59050 [Actinoplanes derwentensis]SDT00331.1 hypothetical protein SAMN04489716_2226 [Actinoplanes derwentensis]